ncbi:hypothetical protein PISMIDRAFT_688245 [Pisolithus microcarpus 441]|uniref:Uncharacterized protein n=1 Tax=Pisolithus microcarpus 441 TaxID=765257 RepID=A0A0C9Z209_9AGAM|nr:hypothetical protein PISMIDRAFT_688245 [Pisolithus microcarpus 441]
MVDYTPKQSPDCCSLEYLLGLKPEGQVAYGWQGSWDALEEIVKTAISPLVLGHSDTYHPPYQSSQGPRLRACLPGETNMKWKPMLEGNGIEENEGNSGTSRVILPPPSHRCPPWGRSGMLYQLHLCQANHSIPQAVLSRH